VERSTQTWKEGVRGLKVNRVSLEEENLRKEGDKGKSWQAEDVDGFPQLGPRAKGTNKKTWSQRRGSDGNDKVPGKRRERKKVLKSLTKRSSHANLGKPKARSGRGHWEWENNVEGPNLGI